MAQARRWCFTLNNPTDEQQREGGVNFGPHMRGAIYQVEQGENGTVHLQGYVEFTRPLKLGSVKLLLARAHWEVARGTAAQAAAYASKVESRIAGPYSMGEPIGGAQGKRTDLDEAAELIAQGKPMNIVAMNCPKVYIKYSRGMHALQSTLLGPRRLDEAPVVFYTFGPTNVGKTRAADECAPNAFWKNNTKWWDMYVGQREVLWDDFRGRSVAYSDALRLMDRYPCSVEYKGGMIELQASTWFLTSNVAPWQIWNIKNQDPWHRRISLVIYKDEDTTRFFNDVRECKMYMGDYVHEEEE